jgi:hypothetical protein
MEDGLRSRKDKHMTTWVLTTVEKKSVEEIEFWFKDGKTIKRSTGFRWGKVYCESDEKPDIDLENPEGISVFDCGYDFELDSLDDGWSADVEYPDDMDEEEQERMNELWDEDAYEAWEGEGWSNDDSETWFYGPLNLEEE